MAVLGGSVISKLKMSDQVEDFVFNNQGISNGAEKLSPKDRFDFAKDQVLDIINKVWLYIIIGVGIGAMIHNYIPQTFISAILGQDKWYSVIVATFVGIPMYADIFGTLPIAEALVLKGVGIGTALAFMMGVTALSFPAMVMLSKVVKKKLLWTFFLLTSFGILIIGYTFNLFAHLLL